MAIICGSMVKVTRGHLCEGLATELVQDSRIAGLTSLRLLNSHHICKKEAVRS